MENNLKAVVNRVERAVRNVDKTIGNFFYGDIYNINHIQEIKYPAVVVTNSTHNATSDYITYYFNIFYVDRLTADKKNKLDVQSAATMTLKNTMQLVDENYLVNDNYELHTFEEKFNDVCAGAYINVGIRCPLELCDVEPIEEIIYLDKITLTQNGTVTAPFGRAYKEVTVNVPKEKLAQLSEVYTENGSYNIEAPVGYGGIKNVDVRVEVEPELIAVREEFNKNGSYEVVPPEGFDGLSGVEVRVSVDPPQPELIAITKEYSSNGSYDIEVPEGYDGLSGVEVRVNVDPVLANVSVDYDKNGSYTIETPEGYDGISSVDVNVATPSGGVPLEQVKGVLEGTSNIIYIPEGVTSLRAYAFYNYGLSPAVTVDELIVPDYITVIGNYAFAYANIKKVVIPSSVVLLPMYLFSQSKIEECIINTGGGMSLSATFYFCSNLKKVVFNAPVNGSLISTFYRCTALEEVDFSKCTQVPSLSNVNVFLNVPSTCVVKIPAALYDSWTNATNWSALNVNYVAV